MTGVFITARLGSTRLAEKHLIEVKGKSFIAWLVERFIAQFKAELESNNLRIFITTSELPINKQFEKLFNSNYVKIFYGSDANIPLRHLECAEFHKIENIIAIDGDDILCSTSAARNVYNDLLNGKNIVQTIGLPLGMNVMGYKSFFLKKSVEKYENHQLETGWGKIFDVSEIHFRNIEGFENFSELRMTLDYIDDSLFFTKVIDCLNSEILTYDDKNLVNKIIDNNWWKINSHLNDEYWDNFNKQKQQENL